MTHQTFWIRNPALLFGVSLLIGTSSCLFWPFLYGLPLTFLWGAYLIFLRRWPLLFILIGGYFYGHYFSANLESAKIGYFSPASLKPHSSPFTKSLLYTGMLTVDSSQVPCTVHYPLKKEHPPANSDYILKGTLKKHAPYAYAFRVKEWIPVPHTWSLAEFRFQMKERVRAFLDQNLHRPRVATFLGSLLTGDVEDRMLRYEFGKLGLQHILAISGFHFAILIAFCSYFLGLFLKNTPKILSLLVLVNLYFLFVGALPAVQRSYLTALFFLLGKLLRRPSTGLNLLGASLFIEVLLQPHLANNLGFQLSFLSCLGILLFRPLFLPFAQTLFPSRTRITSFFREAISVTLGVNVAILPLLLFHFHSFPLLSLLYNLFFPFLVSVCLFLLLLSLLFFPLLPVFATPLFYLTDWLTAQLLELGSYPPLFLDHSLRLSFPAPLIPPYLFLLFCISLLTNTAHTDYDVTSRYGDRSSAG